MDEEIGGAARQVTAPLTHLLRLVWGWCSDFVRFWSPRDPGRDQLVRAAFRFCSISRERELS
jgi:hypothetical protein